MKKITINTGQIEGRERLKLYFEYDKEVVSLIKTIPGARWDPGEKCWHVATQAGGVDKLNLRFAGRLVFETDRETGRQGDGGTGRLGEDAVIGQIPKGLNMNRANSRSGEVSFDRNVRLNVVPEEFIKTMVLKNYSPNTIRTYKSMMQEFLEYHKQFDPAKITEEQIRDYLLYLLDERKISIS